MFESLWVRGRGPCRTIMNIMYVSPHSRTHRIKGYKKRRHRRVSKMMAAFWPRWRVFGGFLCPKFATCKGNWAYKSCFVEKDRKSRFWNMILEVLLAPKSTKFLQCSAIFLNDLTPCVCVLVQPCTKLYFWIVCYGIFIFFWVFLCKIWNKNLWTLMLTNLHFIVHSPVIFFSFFLYNNSLYV